MIPFNKSSVTEVEINYMKESALSGRTSGDGPFTFKVYEKLKEILGLETMLLTTSGTTALEMSAILSDFDVDDEVIVPSFTFSSTANSFMLRRAKPVFCDIRKDTFNIDETKIEELITPKTKAIYTVDYAGFPAEADAINEIAKKHNLLVIEDAAQAVGSKYKGRTAGTLGTFGCYSFHETKNYSMGEGGMLVINDKSYLDRAEIIREKGTNRRQVLNGLTDKYTWHDIGSSFLPSDTLAAMLYGQLERFDEIMEKRMAVWNAYYDQIKELEKREILRGPVKPEHIQHNAHMFNIILPDSDTRTKLVDKLREKEIMAYICYVPLHSAPLGRKLGYNPETCLVTESYGERVLRLPLYADMTVDDATYVCDCVKEILG